MSENSTKNASPLYYNVMLQMFHDTANFIQKMIVESYQLELAGTDVKNINRALNQMSQLHKIYVGLYAQSLSTFEDLLEAIQILNRNPIEVTGDKPNPKLEQLILVYCLWITKHHGINLDLLENRAIISFPDQLSEEKLSHYILIPDEENTIGPYGEIIHTLMEDNIYIKASNAQIVLGLQTSPG